MFSFKHYRTTFTLILFSLSMFSTSTSFAQQKPYDSIVVFGSSLSDPGNAFVVLSDPSKFGFDESCNPLTPMNVPPYDTLDALLIPDGSYAKGGHHVSNGATWVEHLARGKGLSGFVRPALRNKGMEARNYAIGGARANDYSCRFNLSNQLGAYLASFSEMSADTLFIIELGSNDLRDALATLPNDPAPIIENAITNIGTAIVTLYSLGARQFLLMNAPDIGQTPAVLTLDSMIPGLAAAATGLTNAYNLNLLVLQGNLNSYPNMDVRIFDLNALLYSIIANPDSYGIEITNAPCITPNVPPYKCSKPDTYLFWDGIHPTEAVHRIMARGAAEVLYAPLP